MIRGVVNRSACLRHVSLRLRHVCSCCYWLLTDACLLRSIYLFIYIFHLSDSGGWFFMPVGKETPLFAAFVYKLHHFTKTGSGQTQGILGQKRVVVFP
eukprot:COSAG06_NODE_288_length_18224_cov_8.849948_11_plen_98_part_00